MTDWKDDERDVAKWIGGWRNPLNGFSQADSESDTVTVEHKARRVANFPLWLLKAFDQRKLNLRLYPEKKSFVVLSVHFGKGNKTRHFVATEVDYATDAFTETAVSLEALAERIKKLPTTEDDE